MGYDSQEKIYNIRKHTLLSSVLPIMNTVFMMVKHVPPCHKYPMQRTLNVHLATLAIIYKMSQYLSSVKT